MIHYNWPFVAACETCTYEGWHYWRRRFDGPDYLMCADCAGQIGRALERLHLYPNWLRRKRHEQIRARELRAAQERIRALAPPPIRPRQLEMAI